MLDRAFHVGEALSGNLKSSRDVDAAADIARSFDEVLGGAEVLPEEKGLLVTTAKINNQQIIEISFPRSGGGFDEIWQRRNATKNVSKEVVRALPKDITQQEKDKSTFLTLLLKQEGILINTKSVGYSLHNDPIGENWLIEDGPRLTISIPVSCIDTEKLKEKVEKKILLAEAGGAICQIAESGGIGKEKIKWNGVEGITFEYPCYVAVVSLAEDITNLKGELKNTGLGFEIFPGDGQKTFSVIRIAEENCNQETLDNLKQKLRDMAGN